MIMKIKLTIMQPCLCECANVLLSQIPPSCKHVKLPASLIERHGEFFFHELSKMHTESERGPITAKERGWKHPAFVSAKSKGDNRKQKQD